MNNHAVLQAAADAVFSPTGTAMPCTRLFGCALLPVVKLRPQVHQARCVSGDGPQLDADVLELWEWPDFPAPQSPVVLVGIAFAINRPEQFRRACILAHGWRAFAPTALFAPPAVTADATKRWECELAGVGLSTPHLSGDPHDPLVPAAPDRRLPRRRVVDRWIEETLYAHAIDTGALPTAATLTGGAE